MNIILFDQPGRLSLFPIVATRPVANIRAGMLTMAEKWASQLKAQVSMLVPAYLAVKFSAKFDVENLYINAAVLPDKALLDDIKVLEKGVLLENNGRPLAFWGPQIDWESLPSFILGLKIKTVQYELLALENTWDVIVHLEQFLKDDFQHLDDRFTTAALSSWVTAIVPEQIFAGSKVKIGACILNASEGPIVIDDEAEIMDGAMVKGPVYIGKHSCVKMGAKIYGPVSIGEHCRLGGEVSDVIFQAYSNKGHDGFLGHSYLGEWCNLGADTNVSNLKNNYDKVRMWNYQTRGFDHTGLQFLGLVMGDHGKTGINAMINSGTVMGVAANIHGSGFPRNFIPDFETGSTRKMEVFQLPQVFKMAEAMMDRRQLVLNEADRQILASLFELTESYR
jgi:UDP-N-acetylglucosamine diphosphorylase/glucosamine-1-phosphate N-acetyltransferase